MDILLYPFIVLPRMRTNLVIMRLSAAAMWIFLSCSLWQMQARITLGHLTENILSASAIMKFCIAVMQKPDLMTVSIISVKIWKTAHTMILIPPLISVQYSQTPILTFLLNR